jgi:hypothetical protein
MRSYVNQAKISYSIKGILSDPATSLKAHLFLAFLSLVLFGLLGLYFSVANIKKNLKELESLKAEEFTLQNNKFDLVEAKEALIRAEPYLGLLDEAIPNEEELHLYLPVLAQKASTSGFILTDMGSSQTLPESVSLGTSYKGDIMSSHTFFGVLEQSPRPGNIQFIEYLYDPDKETQKTKVEFSIYFVPYNVLDLAMPVGGKIDTEFLRKEFSTAYE